MSDPATRAQTPVAGTGQGIPLLDHAPSRVLVVLSDSALVPGRYRVVPLSLTAFADGGRDALVVYLVADLAERSLKRALIRFMALDSGEVRLEATDGRRATGVIQGTGWAAELDPRHPRRVAPDVGFNAVFDARAVGDSGGSEPGV